MKRFITPIVVWKIFYYRCQSCGLTIPILLQKGVESWEDDHIPSPFSINCPHKCIEIFPMQHVYSNIDNITIPYREPEIGEYVFLYDKEVGAAKPVTILDNKNWIVREFGVRGRELDLKTMECDEKALKARKDMEKQSRENYRMPNKKGADK